MYFTYKVRYTNSSTEIPEFPIQPEIALELLMAANFLDCWTQEQDDEEEEDRTRDKTRQKENHPHNDYYYYKNKASLLPPRPP